MAQNNPFDDTGVNTSSPEKATALQKATIAKR
jgi:hypothetical protein